MPLSNITLIIRKIFDDYDEKNGAQQKTDYTQRAQNIVQIWTQSMAKEGLTTKLICELHRLVCEDEWIPINDPKGGISGFAKSGEYRNIQVISPSSLYKDSKIAHFHPKDIGVSMEKLVTTLNNVFVSNPAQELLIENILAFILEFLIIHPFANQNGRLAQVLMELFAFYTGLKAFNISKAIRLNKKAIVIAEEEAILTRNVNLFLQAIQTINQNAGVA